MKATWRILLAALLVVGAAGCNGRTDKTDGGGVLLSISDFGTLPLQASVTSGPFQIDSITVRSVAKDPTGTTSSLMDTELRTYQVTYARTDQGTRLPPPLVGNIFGTVPVSGTDILNNLPFVLSPQLAVAPLADLARTGIDSETGSAIVSMRVTIQIFGRTLSGKDVATDPASFTLEFKR